MRRKIKTIILILTLATCMVTGCKKTVEETEYTFEDLSKYSYDCSTGAGGWSTWLTIEKDGYFEGGFVDNDMGDTGEGYEDGTRYSSVFSGYFSDLKKVDEYTYEMTRSEISYKEEIGTTEISYGIKYIYTDEFGLSETERFLVYFPGTPIYILGEEVATRYIGWMEYTTDEKALLTIPVIVNEKIPVGFAGRTRALPTEEARMEYNNYRDGYDEFTKEIEKAESKEERLEKAAERYDMADTLLNSLWRLIKYNTTEEAFQSILEEQRSWLQERDKQAKNLTELEYQNTMAALTMERCKKLLEYINENLQ